MAKSDIPPTFACMTPRSDLRRVHEPHDERVADNDGQRVRRALAKVVAVVRR